MQGGVRQKDKWYLTRIKVGVRVCGQGVAEPSDKEKTMSNTPHELSQDFAEHADLIHTLKTSDAHFAKLAEIYHEVNRAVHRAETNVEPLEQLAEVELRKKRSLLKDEIATYLSTHPTS